MEPTVNISEYEISYLLDPSIPEAEIEAKNLRIQALIAQTGGIINRAFVPQKKRLFYPIKKQNQAYLGTFYFSVNSDELSKFERTLQLDPKVLRFIILNRAETIKQEAGVVLAKKPSTTEEEQNKPTEESNKKETTEQSFEEKLKQILKS